MSIAGALFTYWWVPQGTVAFRPPAERLLEFADYHRRSGYTYLFVGLFVARESLGGDLARGAPDQLEGDSLTIDSVPISNIGASSAGITINTSAPSELDSIFGPGQTYEEPIVDFQTEDGVAQYDDLVTISDAVATWSSPDDATILARVRAGDRFIFAIYYRNPVSDEAMTWDDQEAMEWDDDTVMEWDS